jgi:ABC-type Fe3+-siderophore transport system permease subunit
MIAILAVYSLSQRAGMSTIAPLILAGIAINAIADGGLGYLSVS